MSNIVFATGGTTGESQVIHHRWENFNFTIENTVSKIQPVFKALSVVKVANCLKAGNLWGGFIFAHEICHQLNVFYYPFSSSVDIKDLVTWIDRDDIDTIMCLPNFAEKLIREDYQHQLFSLRNIFYLGEDFPKSAQEKIRSILPQVRIIPIAYTTQETGPIGYQCLHLEGNTYHIHDHVDINLDPETNEVIVSLAYPSGDKVVRHSTRDTGRLSETSSCPCGYQGMNITFTGRLETHHNIAAISVSIREFIDTLNHYYNHHLESGHIQVIVVQNQGVGVLILLDKQFNIPLSEMKAALLSSPLLKVIYKDSAFFHVQNTERVYFLKSDVSNKVKPFISLTSYPGNIPGEKVALKA